MKFAFTGFELDDAVRELTSGGRPVNLQPMSFDLLLYLVKARGRVVSKQELLQAVWKGRFVADVTLSGRINDVRRAIGDDGVRQHLLKTVARRGFRFVGEVETCGEPVSQSDSGAFVSAPSTQTVRFCASKGGARIAYAESGEGEALVKSANWVTHIETEWRGPVWGPLLHWLSRNRRLIRYDARGNGLSDWNIAEMSFESWIEDLRVVADAARLESFDLFGMSQGAAVAIAFAARYPERVRKLVLIGAYVRGRNVATCGPASAEAAALASVVRAAWGSDNDAYLRALGSLYMPDAAPDRVRRFSELQRLASNAENAARIRAVCDSIDVTGCLSRVRCPTLVIHARRDVIAPFEQGREIASRISKSRFVALDTGDHVPDFDRAVWRPGQEAVDKFLARPSA